MSAMPGSEFTSAAAPPVYRHRVFRGQEALTRAEHTYRYLWQRTQPAPPTLDFDWVATWWDLHGTEGDPFLVQLERDGKAVAMAPLYIRRRELSRRGALRSVCFLGTGEDDADEVYGTNTSWLGAAEHARAMTRSVASALLEHRGAWDRLWLSNVIPGACLVEELAADLGNHVLQRTTSTTDNWIIANPGSSIDDYIGGLGKSKLRTRMRSILKRAERDALSCRWITDADEALAAYDQLAELHTRQWEARGKDGACRSPIFTEFQRRMIKIRARQGRLWMQRIGMAGEPIVVSLDIPAGDCLYTYLAGIDMDRGKYAPGILSLLNSVRRATEMGLRRIDMLAGEYGYKSRLTSETMPLTTLEVYAKSPAARAWLSLRRLRDGVRSA